MKYKSEIPINQRVGRLIELLADGKQIRFAEAVGISPSMISDLFGKRQSRPGFDMLEKIGIAYPQVRMDWLINGREPMLRELPPRVQSSPDPMFNDMIEKRNADQVEANVRSDLADAAHELFTRQEQAARLITIRKIRGFSFASAAQQSGITEKELAIAEAADGDFSSESLIKLANLYDVSYDYLVNGYDTDYKMLQMLNEYQRQTPARLRADLDNVLARLSRAGI